MSLPVIILGGGGHAKVLIDALRLQSVEIIGITTAVPDQQGKEVEGIPVIGTDIDVLRHPPENILLVNAIGSIRATKHRQTLFEDFKSKGYSFATVIHPSAIIASNAKLSEGVQIMAGAIIQSNCKIGDNSIVNTKTSIDHDCVIGSHVHLAPGVTVSGEARIENGAHVGTGATVIQGIKIGSFSTVGAGSVVIRDVRDGATVVGVPSREVR